MRIIDEKGKLLGVINLVDLLILLFIIVCIPLFLYSYRFYNQMALAKNPPPEVLKAQRVTVLFKTDPIPDYLVKAIRAGTEGKFGLGAMRGFSAGSEERSIGIAEIEKVVSVEPYRAIHFDDKGWRYVVVEHPTKKEVVIRLKVKRIPKRLKITMPFLFKSLFFDLTGTIIDIIPPGDLKALPGGSSQ